MMPSALVIATGVSIPLLCLEGVPDLSSAPKDEVLLLSHFSRVPLCATPEMAAHQAPPSLGFSRQDVLHYLPEFAQTHGH